MDDGYAINESELRVGPPTDIGPPASPDPSTDGPLEGVRVKDPTPIEEQPQSKSPLFEAPPKPVFTSERVHVSSKAKYTFHAEGPSYYTVPIPGKGETVVIVIFTPEQSGG